MDFTDGLDGHLLFEDPPDIAKVLFVLVDREEICVGFDGVFSMLLEDVLLKTIVTYLCKYSPINSSDVNWKDLSLLRIILAVISSFSVPLANIL